MSNILRGRYNDIESLISYKGNENPDFRRDVRNNYRSNNLTLCIGKAVDAVTHRGMHETIIEVRPNFNTSYPFENFIFYNYTTGEKLGESGYQAIMKGNIIKAFGLGKSTNPYSIDNACKLLNSPSYY